MSGKSRDVSESAAPPGYEAFTERGARVVVKDSFATAVRSALTAGTLHTWASRQAGAVALGGRAAAWAAALPGGIEVVVRHSRHGGVLRFATKDLFLPPTRAPRELASALRLAAARVPTPEVVAFAVYPALWPLVRADVVTRRIRGADFPDAWRASPEGLPRRTLVRALATLLQQLRAAGALHPDLNLRNVLVAVQDDEPAAFVLDVDRVRFGLPGSKAIAARNLARVFRSARKWRKACNIDLEVPEHAHVLAASVHGSPARSAE